jgi:cytosine/adenosine deaminase-related metal-dependent hydrolase
MRRLLIQNATVITMDPQFGDLRPGDVLIEGEQIAAVGARIDPAGEETLDGRAFIVILGLVTAHMHTWQTGQRAISSNWRLFGYFRWVHAGLATRFKHEDIRIANLVGALNQLNCGTTTLVDWCHNSEPIGFRMPLGMKRDRLVLAAAEEASVPMPMASLIRDRMLAAMAQGMAESDRGAFARISLREAGL